MTKLKSFKKMIYTGVDKVIWAWHVSEMVNLGCRTICIHTFLLFSSTVMMRQLVIIFLGGKIYSVVR